jgi:hypothetical protein
VLQAEDRHAFDVRSFSLLLVGYFLLRWLYSRPLEQEANSVRKTQSMRAKSSSTLIGDYIALGFTTGSERNGQFRAKWRDFLNDPDPVLVGPVFAQGGFIDLFSVCP